MTPTSGRRWPRCSRSWGSRWSWRRTRAWRWRCSTRHRRFSGSGDAGFDGLLDALDGDGDRLAAQHAAGAGAGRLAGFEAGAVAAADAAAAVAAAGAGRAGGAGADGRVAEEA